MFSVGLGDQVKDRITGFSGVVIARTEWLNSCNRITVQPKELKDGKPVEAQVFDEYDLKVVKAAAFKPGPQLAAARAKPARAAVYAGGPPSRGISEPRR